MDIASAETMSLNR